MLEGIQALGFYDVVRLVGYDLVLCFLGVRRLQEVDWSLYGGNDTPFSAYHFSAGSVLVVSPLLANKRSKSGFGVSVDIPGHEVTWL